MLVLNLTLALIMLALGLGLTLDEFRAIALRPHAAAVGLVGQLLLLPAAAFFLAWVFDLQGPLAVGLVLIAACPGGAHSNLFAHLAGGDTALSVALTGVSGLAILGTLPLWVGLALASFGGHAAVALPVDETLIQVLGLLGAPLLTGMGLLGDTAHAVPAIVYSLLVYGTAGALVFFARRPPPPEAA